MSKVEVSPATVCPGETARIRVLTKSPSGARGAVSVHIQGVPGYEAFQQFRGKAGSRLVPITARASDGTFESTSAVVHLKDCDEEARVYPHLVGEADVYVPDLVRFTVLNAPEFESASTTYLWDFDDGSKPVESTVPVARHRYAPLTDGAESKTYHVKVTVKPEGLVVKSADPTSITSTVSFVVVDTYNVIRNRRGSIEPDVTTPREVLSLVGTEYEADFSVHNRESRALTVTRRRVDQHPCDADATSVVGLEEPESFAVAAGTSATRTLRLTPAELRADTCAITVHYWGSVDSGPKAEFNVHFDLPGQLGALPVDEFSEDLLNDVVRRGLVTNPNLVTEREIVRLYQDRKLSYSALTTKLLASVPPPAASKGWCNPDAPGKAPQSGYTCQPTGGWHVDSPGTPQAYIANALKGDTVLVRSCDGQIAPILGALDPPQRFTHTGIMTQDRVQIRHSTGSIAYLKTHPNGLVDKPTDGFKEDALRFMWPGTVTASIEEAFGGGRALTTPEGTTRRIAGFSPDEAKCASDRSISFPLVLKPAARFETAVRPQLHRAAEVAKTIHGHYRFSDYSKAAATAALDRHAPPPITDARGNPQSWGQTPTVCSSFVRLALLGAGARLDVDKARPVRTTRPGPADGLFAYTKDERRAAGAKLYSSLYSEVQTLLEQEADDSWWGRLLDGATNVLSHGATGILGFAQTTSTAIRWATDTPDDVANQVTNCFAADQCSEGAKDSEAWRTTGDGVAVSPDDLMNYYDPPRLNEAGVNVGGVYGYMERAVYRGKRYRPMFAWLPSSDTRTLRGRVLNATGTGGWLPVENARVEIQGLSDKTAMTDAQGQFSIEAVPGGNLSVYASKFVSGELREGRSCYVPDQVSGWMNQVDCDNFSKTLAADVNTAEILLHGPPETFRHVLLQTQAKVLDGDCWPDGDDTESFSGLLTCDVSELSPTGTFGITQKDLCADEAGGRIRGTCTYVPPSSVRVDLQFDLYESVTQSCGADDHERGTSRTFTLSPGESARTKSKISNTSGTCTSDYVAWDISMTNNRAP